jgi:metal-responsive CopG/Arc/MetJ family transcriptional regulator
MFAPPLGQWYVSGMKVKTSVTLSEELLSAISAETDQSNRSAFIEEATWRYLRQRQREARDKREFERINEHADELNEEAFDVLEFQADV